MIASERPTSNIAALLIRHDWPHDWYL